MENSANARGATQPPSATSSTLTEVPAIASSLPDTTKGWKRDGDVVALLRDEQAGSVAFARARKARSFSIVRRFTPSAAARSATAARSRLSARVRSARHAIHGRSDRALRRGRRRRDRARRTRPHTVYERWRREIRRHHTSAHCCSARSKTCSARTSIRPDRGSESTACDSIFAGRGGALTPEQRRAVAHRVNEMIREDSHLGRACCRSRKQRRPARSGWPARSTAT